MTATGSWHAAVIHRADAFVAWLANSKTSLVILAVPTAATLWFMRFGGIDTPDQSLLPHLPALVIYGGFFVLGWMLSRQRELISQFARLTPQRWILAGLGIAAILLLGEIERDPAILITLNSELNQNNSLSASTGVRMSKVTQLLLDHSLADVALLLLSWVEEGKAPDRLMAEKRDSTGKVIRTRPLFPFPRVARYKGTGSTDAAANFVSRIPKE